MLIILEGPDGVGKTTLAERLAHRIRVRFPSDSVEIIKKGPPTEHPLGEYVKPLLSYRPRSGHHIICDRWHWGERIYPYVLKRGTKMNNGVWRYIELFLETRAAIVVAVSRDYDEHLCSFKVRGDDLIKPEQLRLIGHHYSMIQQDSLLPSVAYRAVTHDTDPHHDEIINGATTRDALTRDLNQFTTYVGPRHPKTLLLGDIRKGEFALGDGTAFGPYPGTSGHYLMRALTETTWRMRYVGLANACDVDDPILLWKTLGCPTSVVTLGANAHHCLRAAGIPHGTVPHPQFIRRFYHREHEWYGGLIRSALPGGDLLACRPTP